MKRTELRTRVYRNKGLRKKVEKRDGGMLAAEGTTSIFRWTTFSRFGRAAAIRLKMRNHFAEHVI